MDPLTIHKDEAARLADRIQEHLHDIERTIGLALSVLGAAFAIVPRQARRFQQDRNGSSYSYHHLYFLW